jgi:hypothetical protein
MLMVLSYTNAFTTANNALPKAGGQLSGVVSSSSSIIASALTSNTSVTINTNAMLHPIHSQHHLHHKYQ